MYRDKAIDEVASILSSHVDEWFLSAVKEDRAASPAELAAVICSFGGSVAGTYDKVSIAYDKAFDQSDAGDLILVFGSFPVVGEVLQHRGISV
jgi:dihydrofolate synthase/folylpolyglutamate synthase